MAAPGRRGPRDNPWVVSFGYAAALWLVLVVVLVVGTGRVDVGGAARLLAPFFLAGLVSGVLGRTTKGGWPRAVYPVAVVTLSVFFLLLGSVLSGFG
jgi:hypothetical protein